MGLDALPGLGYLIFTMTAADKTAMTLTEYTDALAAAVTAAGERAREREHDPDADDRPAVAGGDE